MMYKEQPFNRFFSLWMGLFSNSRSSTESQSESAYTLKIKFDKKH